MADSSNHSVPTTTLHAHCHCKLSTLTVTLPISSLPLPTHFCHCSICRHTHGTLCTIHAPIPTPCFNQETFTAYESSEHVTRWFCSTCGTHMVDFAVVDGKEGKGQWHISASVVDGREELWDFREHLFVESTGDGGLAVLIEEINGKKLKRWNGCDAESREWIPPSSPQKNVSRKNGDVLKASCHCHGIQFTIPRPPPNTHTSSPPHMTPTDKSKYYALLDVCTSCRFSAGCAVVPWCFPLGSSIQLPDGSPYRPDAGTAKIYHSSPDVTRTFCGVCGATATFMDEGREEKHMVDVAVGLLEVGEGEGVMREGWLEWRKERVAFGEDAVWKGVVGSLVEGMGRVLGRGGSGGD